MEQLEAPVGTRVVEAVHPTQGLRFRELFSLHGYTDTDGRLLGEHRAAREGYRGAPTKHAACPYSGSRAAAGRPMNVSALKQMADNWDDIIDSLSFMHDAYRRMAGLGPEPLPLGHVWRMFVLGTSLPSYLFFRAPNPLANGELPGSVSAFYKVILGMKYTAEEMILEGLLAGDDVGSQRPDGQTLFDYAESHGLFVGEEESCAGAPRSILETLQTIVEGRPRKRREGQLPIQSVIDDPRRWLSFGRGATALFCAMLAYLTEANHLQDRLLVTLGARERGLASLVPLETGPEVRMILALGLKNIVWKLAPLPEAARHAAAMTYAHLAELAPGGSAMEDALFAILPSASTEGRREALRAELAPLVPPGAGDVGEIAALLAEHVLLERRALDAIAAAERAMNAAAGREEPSLCSDGSALAGYCGNTIGQVFQDRLGPSFRVGYDGSHTHLNLAERTFVLR